MEQVSLKDFIAKTLIEICNGIAESQKEIESKIGNCLIAPAQIDGKDVYRETTVVFDVALATNVMGSSKAGGGVNIKVKGIQNSLGVQFGTPVILVK